MGAVELELTDSLASLDEPGPAPADRPDLAALRAGVQARDAGVLRARSQWLPSVAAFGNLSWHDRDIGLAGGPRNWTAGLLVRWVPFRGLAGLGAVVAQRGPRVDPAAPGMRANSAPPPASTATSSSI